MFCYGCIKTLDGKRFVDDVSGMAVKLVAGTIEGIEGTGVGVPMLHCSPLSHGVSTETWRPWRPATEEDVAKLIECIARRTCAHDNTCWAGRRVAL